MGTMVQTHSANDEVPARFVLAPEDRPKLEAGVHRGHALPVVDLSGLRSDAVPSVKATTLRGIASACHDWGFFHAVNHGIPEATIENARRAARAFFELPMRDKDPFRAPAELEQKSGDALKLHGYGRTCFFRGEADDWMDSLFGFLAPPAFNQLHLWPSQPPDLRSAVESYGAEIQALFQRLLTAMSEDLCFDHHNHLAKMFEGNNLFFRANYYPPCPRPDLVLGTHGHTDHGCLTVLLQDKDLDGLQVCKDNEWISVDPVPGAVVINIGDQLSALTNGKYKSALHRGVVTKNKTIMTLVAHLDPPPKSAH